MSLNKIEKIEAVETQISMELYQKFSGDEDSYAILMEHGFKNMQYSIDKLKINAAKAEKEYEKVINKRNDLKKELNKCTKASERLKADEKEHLNKVRLKIMLIIFAITIRIILCYR